MTLRGSPGARPVVHGPTSRHTPISQASSCSTSSRPTLARAAEACGLCGGHMFYNRAASRRALHDDAEALFRAALKAENGSSGRPLDLRVPV